LEQIITWIIITLIFLVIIIGILFRRLYKELKSLKSRLGALEEIVDVPREEIGIDLKIIERKILTSKDSELTEYAQKLYSGKNVKSISNNYNKLAMLDKNIIEYGLIRASALEDSYDLSKFFPPLVAFIIALLTSYAVFFKNVISSPFLHNSLPIILSIGIFAYLSLHVGDTRGKRLSIIYFKGLLLYAKEHGKNLR